MNSTSGNLHPFPMAEIAGLMNEGLSAIQAAGLIEASRLAVDSSADFDLVVPILKSIYEFRGVDIIVKHTGLSATAVELIVAPRLFKLGIASEKCQTTLTFDRDELPSVLAGIRG